MSTLTLDEAKERLPQLVDRALTGEPVVITIEGQPAVEIRSIRPRQSRPVTQADIDWLDVNRVGKRPAALDAATEVRRMRDEGC
jgi:prevent-host-death family protein